MGGVSVGGFYSAAAEEYRRLWAPELVGLARPLLDELPLGDAKLVLDAGAGAGTLLSEIQARARAAEAKVVGVDLAEGMLRLAPRHFPVAVMDITRLGLRGDRFDVIVLAFVLFHLPSPLDGLREVGRLLRPGGTVACTTWGADPPYTASEIWAEELDSLGAEDAESLSRHELVDTPEKVEALLSESGFIDTRTWIGPYENQMTAETFLEHRVGHGMSRRRFESLEPPARTICLDRVRRRLQDLGPSDLLHHAEVVYAIATSPPQAG